MKWSKGFGEFKVMSCGTRVGLLNKTKEYYNIDDLHIFHSGRRVADKAENRQEEVGEEDGGDDGVEEEEGDDVGGGMMAAGGGGGDRDHASLSLLVMEM
ncbi:hypothetical protein QVD17_11613 [Tagetes erecta]|uniref:Uncharacterized protein n=1 Tax=Tagetes erecta TaxID=13708 RepID=A0AAD8KTT5_TARER|nr:hypothetical protein QVD17_11613 [Tagetes erecta]